MRAVARVRAPPIHHQAYVRLQPLLKQAPFRIVVIFAVVVHTRKAAGVDSEVVHFDAVALQTAEGEFGGVGDVEVGGWSDCGGEGGERACYGRVLAEGGVVGGRAEGEEDVEVGG